jgi:predicted AAA+ superfamily ATPase
MTDIGLLSARTALSPKAYLDTNNMFTHYKGVLAEQFALQEILAANSSLPIYYWAAEKNNAEIEFVIQYENNIIPLEVKAGKNIKAESLRAYKKLFNPETAIISSKNEYNRSGGNFEIPLYLVGGFGGCLEG